MDRGLLCRDLKYGPLFVSGLHRFCDFDLCKVSDYLLAHSPPSVLRQETFPD